MLFCLSYLLDDALLIAPCLHFMNFFSLRFSAVVVVALFLFSTSCLILFLVGIALK